MTRKTIALLTAALLFAALLIAFWSTSPAAAIPEYGAGTPTVTIVLTPERSINVIKDEPDATHPDPAWLLVTWDGSVNTGYALQYYNLAQFNRYGILSAKLYITVEQSDPAAYPAGFYVCRTTYLWDLGDTWNTHDARCITPKLAFTSTTASTYELDVTYLAQLETNSNRGFQFR